MPVSESAAPEPAWDEAFLRVESYLRAHHIESRVLLNRLAMTIIAKTRLLAASRPGDEIVTLAMQVTHAEMGAWFARVYGEGDWADERFRARGRLALLLTDMPGRWSGYFLSDEPLPEELASAMRTCAFQPGPEVRFSHMPPTPLDEILGDEKDPSRPPTGRRPYLRAALACILVGGLMGIAWAATH